ncbi:MAG: 6-carboxytetrahydropterin synthase [Fimbriimonadaceae bacterium]|nr:6-carboxytetrahydropterin synthase [Fimbriimonadaceae bacterium]
MTCFKLTRRVVFSCGHRYWSDRLTADQNRVRFGRFASPFNHGHNYVLDVTAQGPIDPETGMVVNIKDLDRELQSRIVGPLDQKSLNDEIPRFQRCPPTTENLTLYIRDTLAGWSLPVQLTRLRLEEMPTLWCEWHRTGDQERMTLTRSYEFAASHRLHNPALSEERNLELYGKCWNPEGHGHNYVLEVTLEGDPHPETGMLVDLELFDRAVHEIVVDRYDHKNLNADVAELQGLIPTSEVVAQKIWEALEGALPAKLVRVRLLETARNAFEVERQ